MRLIHVKTKRLEEFIGDHVPTYAILSHTWGADHEELTFQEVQNGLPEKVSQGSCKLEGCCQEALKDSISYVWIDTCCIDKTNSTELGEAINSMFRWYQGAKVCYAYLSDVKRSKVASVPIKSLQKSRWFTRGWTLQELIAPMDLRFYDLEWGFLGTKRKLASAVSGITGIPRSLLLGITTLAEASVAQRIKEDIAYCLLGIFDISMPMIYGEGHKAFFDCKRKY
ncbi:HET-domain-containing protein [Xylariaceae sp. AK1471]|nr:HET-domain-containing protein [Xylariaceae sp. AK1471]